MSPRSSDRGVSRGRLVLLSLCFAHYMAVGQYRYDSVSASKSMDSSCVSDDRGWLSIRSVPEGAQVYEDTSFLGTTPIDSVSLMGGKHILRLFYPASVIWSARACVDSLLVFPGRGGAYTIPLGEAASITPFNPELMSGRIEDHVDGHPLELKTNQAGLEYIAGGAMILSGALSAYLKTRSDNKFNAYLLSQDPAVLNQVRALDRWSGVSLVVTEISFAVLTYLFISD